METNQGNIVIILPSSVEQREWNPQAFGFLGSPFVGRPLKTDGLILKLYIAGGWNR
jgi:hypothetical protein